MKKYLFIAALASVALASCAKIEAESPVVNDVQNQISFQAVNHLAQTKADAAFDTEKTFGTYAYFNNGSATKALFMDNQKVSYSGGAWKPDGQTYYWPKSGSIDFVAYAPYASSPWATIDSVKIAASSQTITKDADYLYSDKALAKSYDNSGSGVALTFHHALAQVKVVAQTAKDTNSTKDVSWAIEITKASIDKISSKGKADFISTSGVTTWTLPENKVWTPDTDSYTSSLTGVGKKLSKGADSTIVALSTVLPQTLDAESCLHLEYSIKTTYSSGINFTESFNEDYKLTETFTSITSWQINKSITYRIIIDPLGASGQEHEITFVPVVAAWEEQSGDYTIQK